MYETRKRNRKKVKNLSPHLHYVTFLFKQHKIQEQHIATSFLPAVQVVPEGIKKELQEKKRFKFKQKMYSVPLNDLRVLLPLITNKH